MSFTKISLFYNIFLIKLVLKDKFLLCPLYTYQQTYPHSSVKSLYVEVLGKNITDKQLMVRPGRIELPSHPWQGRVLPLNHDR